MILARAARCILVVVVVTAFCTSDATAGFDEAMAAKQAGDYARAIALFKELVAAEPNNATYLYQLGTVQGWAGEFDAAAATLQRGLELAPDDLDLQMGYGRVLAWSGQLGRAELIFQNVLAKSPGNLDALNMLGRVQTWNRRYDDAQATFDNVLGIAPANTDALVGRGDVEKLQERFDSARQYYERAAVSDPASAEIRQRLSAVQRAGRWRLDAGFEASSFAGGSREDWSGWDANLRYALDKRTGIALGVERAERFASVDEQFTLTADRRFSDEWSGYARFSATPDADFFANHMVAAGAAWRLRKGTAELPPTLLLLDYRGSNYNPGTAHTAWLGVTQYTTRKFAVTLKYAATRNLNDRWTDGWQFRLDGEPADHWRWHLGYADGRESLSSTVFDFTRSLRTRALFGGAYREFSPAFGLRLDLTHEWAEGLPDRNAIHVGFTTRF